MADTARDDQIKKLAQALGQPAQEPATQGVGVGDFLRELGAGAVQGAGGSVRAVGEAAAGTNPRFRNRGTAARELGNAISGYGEEISQGKTDAAKQAMENSTPTGDFLRPSQWGKISLGKDPSVAGYGLHAANVVGQAAPTLVSALMSRGEAVPTMFAAGAAGGGGAAQQEQQRIEQMPESELAAVPGYQKRLAAGFTPAQARADLATETGTSAYKATTPISSLSAFTEGLPITGFGQRALGRLVGEGRAARALTGGLIDAVGEGAQEVAEQAGQTAGANAATGEQRSLTEDSFQNFALGALGGGPFGAVGGLMEAPGGHRGEAEAAPQDAQSGVSPVPEPLQSGNTPVPAPAGAGPIEAEVAARRQPPPAPAPTVADAQPSFRAGATNPTTGQVEVAPGVAVNPATGPLSRTVAAAAQRGDMDRAASATMSDGTQFNPDTGEVTAAPQQDAAARRAPEKPKPVGQDELDQIILERLQANPLMDGQLSAQLARALGVNLRAVSDSKKRVREFLAAQQLEQPGDTSLNFKGAATDETQAAVEKPREPVRPDAGRDASRDGRNEGADRPEAQAAAASGRPRPVASADEARAGADALAGSLKKTDRAKGPDGATYMVKENANGEGYHVTRSEDGSTLQHRSPNPAKPWTREEAVRAAADIARERATPKEKPNAEQLRTADAAAESTVRGKPGATAAEDGAIAAAGAENGVATGGVEGTAAAVQEESGQRIAQGSEGAAAPRADLPTGAAQSGTEDAQVAARDAAPSAIRAEPSVPANAAGEAGREGVGAAIRAPLVRPGNGDGSTVRGAPSEQASQTVDAETRAAAPREVQASDESSGDQANRRTPAGGALGRVIRKDEAINRLRNAGMTVRQANEAFAEIGAKHLRADRRFEADVMAKVAEHTAQSAPTIRTGRHNGTYVVDVRAPNGATVSGEGKSLREATMAARKKAAETVAPKAPSTEIVQQESNADAENVWDKQLTPAGRRDAAKRAGLRDSTAKVLWRHLPEEARAKLETAARDVLQGDAEPAKSPATKPSENRLVSDDVAAAARARLKEKLGRLSSGIDPTLIADGAILAVYHIERGARTFAAYARAMIGDLGDNAKQYLAAWYEGARRMPGMNTEGMTPTTEVDASQAAGIPELNEEQNREEVQGQDQQEQGQEGAGGAQTADDAGPAGAVLAGAVDSGDAAGNVGEAGRRRGNAENADAEAAARQQREGADVVTAAGGNDGNGIRSGVDGGRGEGALEAQPPEPVRPAQEQRETRGRAGRGSGSDAGGAGAVQGGGPDAGRSVAGDQKRLPDSGPAGVQPGRAVAEAIETGAVAVQQPAGARPQNYVIPDDLGLGEGGAKTKVAANVAAIETLKRIEADGRRATPDEQAVLARYVGWGGLPQAFRNEARGVTAGWERQVAAVEVAMTADELAAARRSTQDAHYTSREVIGGVYDALQQLGYTGGMTLEPAMGTGNFLGLAPESLRGAQRWKGVELDSITGRIAQQLYPESNITAGRGFQDVAVPVDHFDAVIGNPPFGRTTIFDAANKDISGFSIHNFFFAKSIKALKPGGVLAMVVSNSMLDKIGGKQRRWMAERARFLGAIRLPNDAFKANAGTEVTTDIVFLQKLRQGERAADTAWTEVGSVPDPAGGEAIPLNRYFVEHPEMMLGTMTREGKMRRGGESTLTPRPGQDLAAALRDAAARLPKNVMQQPAPIAPGASAPFIDVRPETPIYGHFVGSDGNIYQRLPDEMDERRSRAVELQGRDADRVIGMIDLRDRMKSLLRAEMADAPIGQLDANRAALNRAYDAFQKKFGYLNSPYNANLFRDDADAFRLRALESNYQRLGAEDAIARGLTPPRGRTTVEVAQKADLLSKRVFQPERKVTVTTAADALGVSLNTYGRVNIPAMADLLGVSADRIVADLGSDLFNDPKAGYVTADEYLSGNVKAKLAAARAAAVKNPEFERNVEALERVQPADISPADIYVSLGSPWVFTEDYVQFANEVIGLGNRIKLTKIPAAQKFVVSGAEQGHERFATQRVSARDLFVKALNNETVQVFDTVRMEGKEHRVINPDATEAARAVVEQMRQEFGEWVWKDQKRRERLSRFYNDTYNTDQSRSYERGAGIVSFPGKVDDSIITLRPKQLSAVWRTIQDGTVLYDHVVGAGKTYTAIAAVMKLRQMGLARKPMVAVPNHLIDQWAGDFMRLYPAAKILAVTESDFAKARRKLLFSRIATGDWDAVIVAHSQFSRIQPPIEFEQKYLNEQIAVYEEAASVARGDGDGRTTKQIEQQRDQIKEKLKKRMEGVAQRDTDTAFFDEMGIDYLFVDEAHEFKNLGFVTKKRNISGMGSAANGGSKKAEDLFIKTQYLQQLNKGRGVVFMTGTPVSNSLAEMFTMQRYLAYGDMQARGAHLFDLWANTFAQESTEYELDSSGRGLKAKTVLKRFLNLPEMMQLYKRFADTVTQDDLQRAHKEKTGKDWPVPKIRGGKPQNVVVKPSPALLSYIEGDIIPRMQAVSGELGARPDPSIDNMLKITNDARLAALDVRLRVPSALDDPNSKPNRIVREALDIYRATAADRGTQLIFCDLSTPKAAAARQRQELMDLQRLADEGDEAAQAKLDKMNPDDMLATLSAFSVYDDVRAKLIAAGVPAREIAFIHDANTDLQKKQLFSRVNNGDVRILMGSTSKMGAGTNVQERLVALHHLDAPWRPSDLEQREGRIIRQGNQLYSRDPAGFEISINRYATERTYDARMWQLIERKAAVVEQIRKADATLREVDDVVGEAANAAEMKAAATGNPLLIEQVEVEGQVKRLSSLKRSYESRRYEAEARISRLEDGGGPAGRHAKELDRAAAGEAAISANPRDPFAIQVDGQTHEDWKEGTAALGAKVAAELTRWSGKGRYSPVPIATYRGASLVLAPGLGYDELHVIYPDPKLGMVGYAVDLASNEGKVSGAGLVTKVNHIISKMEDWRAKADKALARDQRELAEMREVAAQPFRQAEELAQKQERLRDINKALTTSTAGPRSAVAPQSFSAAEDFDLAPQQAPSYVAPTLKTLHARTLRAAIRKAMGDWNDVNVIVVDDGEQLQAMTGVNNPDFLRARGIVRRTKAAATVFLVASNLPDIGQAKRTLAHEAVGHFGMERLLGDQFQRIAADALALVRSNPRYAEIRERLARYTGRPEETLAKEALAMMAEGQYQNGILARLYAAIRTWLRGIPVFSGMHFSHDEIVQLAVAAARGLESNQGKPAAAGAPAIDFDLADVDGAAQTRLDKAAVANIGDRLRDKLTDWKPSLLGALTLRQLGDVAQDYLPQVNRYAATMTRMQTRRNQLQEGAAELAENWEKWQRKNREQSRVLANTMHDATLAGVDPDKPYVAGSVTLASNEVVPVSAAAETADQLEERAQRVTGPGKEILMRDAQRLRAAAEAEPARRAAYDPLKRRFDALPPEAKAIYRQVRDFYAKRADDMLQAVLGRINGLEIPEDQRVSMANQMRAHFESARVTAPYFPLARFGEYWVSATKTIDGKEERRFEMVETRAAQKRAREALRADGWATQIGTKLDMARATDGASGNFVAQVATLLQKAGVDDGVADDIYQLYLRTLPDLSVRKQFIHRKGTAGYDSDALRAFAGHANHSAYQLARLEYGSELGRLVSDMKQRANQLSSDGEDEMAIAAGRMTNEMTKRHQWVMNPTDSSAVQKISSLAFAYYLGASPAAALVNLTQNYVVTFPALAAKHGFVKALTEVNRSMAQTIRTYGHIEKLLSGDEAKAHRELMDMGAIDRTLSHDLAGIGDTDTRTYNPGWRRVMSTISHLFHKAEVFNRESAGLAAYRMARDEGMSHADAVQYASDVIWNTHFDYSNANRARWVQSNAGKVLFSMKQYSQNMTYFLWRQFHQATKGATPELKAEARKKLAGTLGMTALFSGAMGLPLMSIVFGVANALQAMFGDDDEPWDAETEFKNFLADYLGKDWGRVAQVGPIQALTGADISSRTKLDQLWFRDPDRELEGRAMADYLLEQIGGPVAGIGINILRAQQLANDGHLLRAAETAIPKAGRDLIRSVRYAAEGVKDLRGNPLVNDPGPFELLMQASGMTPARVAEQYDVNNALKRYEQHILDRRKTLLDAYAMAVSMSDMEAVARARELIDRFNAANPEIGINRNTIRNSLRSRQRYNDASIGGLVLNRKLDQRLRESVSFGADEE